MATEKILNTRIINKHALLNEWSSSTLKLKEGEIALARIDLPTDTSSTSGENNNISTTPAYIIKVGAKNAEGEEQNFENSAWAYAKAVDVYAWAKAATKPTYAANEITGLKEFVEGISDIDTDLNTKYTFEIPTDGENAGKLVITPNTWTKGTKGTDEQKIVLDVVTPDELNTILTGYVKSVSGKEAIKSTSGQNPEISLALDNSGNVKFTQSDTGLKGTVDLNNFATKDEIPTNYKTKQTAVDDKITDKAHVLDSLTQNENGEISYTVKTLTPADIGAQPAGNYQPAGDYQPAGNYKTQQNPVANPTAAGNATAFIDSISQDANGVITVTKKNITAADLGLSGAMHFLGVTTTEITDNATTTTITINEEDTTTAAGDVVLYGTKEFVFDGNKWHELGDGSSHALKTVTITGTDGLTGGGAIDQNRTISHAVPTGATAGEKIGTPTEGQRTYIKSVTTDKFGHITGYTTGTEEDQDLSNYKTKQEAVSESGATNKTLTKIVQDANGKITEATFEAIAITKSQVTDFDHNHDDKYQKLVPSAGTGHYAVFGDDGQIVDGGELYFLPDIRTTQEAESLENASASLGFAIYDRYDSNESDSGKTFAEFHIDIPDQGGLAVIQPEYESSGNNDESVVAGGNLVIKEKGVTTAKIADQAVGAEQTKAYQKADGTSEEVWVFDCGGAE